MPDKQLLTVQHLKKYFTVRRDFRGRPLDILKAVDDISFSIAPGETLGLVGESGCGKSTVARSLMHIYQPTAGQVYFNGQRIDTATPPRSLCRKMQMIFQDPYTALDPRCSVGTIISEPLDIHRIGSAQERRQRVLELMELVGLRREYLHRFPHEFSGGQRQRIGIARALALEPGFIICDEPVSALDVSIQAQIINLLERLQAQLRLSYLFIAHDLAVVKHISHRIAVMYLGKIVELADSSAISTNPQHPYTQALLSAVPIPDPDVKRPVLPLSGELPSPLNPPDGCRFAARCPHCQPQCTAIEPPLRDMGNGHLAACHLLHN